MAIDRVGKHYVVRVHSQDEAMEPHQLTEAIRDVDGVMICGMRLAAEAIATASRLHIVANIDAGYDNIDLEACTRRGILVTNTPDVVTEVTADLRTWPSP